MTLACFVRLQVADVIDEAGFKHEKLAVDANATTSFLHKASGDLLAETRFIADGLHVEKIIAVGYGESMLARGRNCWRLPKYIGHDTLPFVGPFPHEAAKQSRGEGFFYLGTLCPLRSIH